jgi:carotenoid cleavage dioxygenase-like enzyme
VVRGFRSADSIIPGPSVAPNNNGSEGSKATEDEKSTKPGIAMDFFCRLYQWRLNLKTKAISGEYLPGTDFSLDFPMINNQYTGMQHSYAYAPSG